MEWRYHQGDVERFVESLVRGEGFDDFPDSTHVRPTTHHAKRDVGAKSRCAL